MAHGFNNSSQMSPNRESISRSNSTINPDPNPNQGLHSNPNPNLVHDFNPDPDGIPNTVPSPNPNQNLAVRSNPNPTPTSDPNPKPQSVHNQSVESAPDRPNFQEANVENSGGTSIPLGEGMSQGQVMPKQVNPEIATGRRL